MQVQSRILILSKTILKFLLFAEDSRSILENFVGAY